MINVSICLSDIPKESITTSEKNGKKYLSIIVDKRKEVDQYGKTHTVYISQSKEDREAKEPKKYIGNGKEFVFQSNVPNNEAANDEFNDTDTLPF